MIQMKDVGKSYGDVRPITGLTLEIEDGEFVAIVGPSGSGKTTLLNVAAGLLTPSEGQVHVDGMAIYDLNRIDRIAFRRKNFGFVFQTFNLLPYFTVAQNVAVPLYLAALDQAEQREQVHALLASVGLADKADCFPGELSAGERQRVAIARAFANNPRIIFSDEPTGNLDVDNGREVMAQMKELNQQGATVLLVTHDAEMAAFAQRQIRLIDGRLVP